MAAQFACHHRVKQKSFLRRAGCGTQEEKGFPKGADGNDSVGYRVVKFNFPEVRVTR